MGLKSWRGAIEYSHWFRVNHSIEMELPICSTAIAQSASQEIFESTRNLSTALAVQ
jgi:hypothetical protein